MLSMNSYGREYIDECRALVDTRIAEFQGLAAAASAAPGGAADEGFGTALKALEVAYFNNMVMVLEMCFVHRQRGMEKKDGNALNEVRSLVTSLTSNDGRLTVEKSIKLNPQTSVLGYHEGDRIEVTEEAFVGLAKAFFAEIEAKFL